MANSNAVALKSFSITSGDVQGKNHMGEPRKDGTSMQNGIYVISESLSENTSNGSLNPMADPAQVKGKTKISTLYVI